MSLAFLNGNAHAERVALDRGNSCNANANLLMGSMDNTIAGRGLSNWTM
jgi:hypothetical protein